jgi:hypothetical protein
MVSASGATFNTSHEWFHGFKAHGKLHNIKVPCDAASADTIAAIRNPTDFGRNEQK